MAEPTDPVERVRRYHQQTKHRFERYANGPETLDWSQQPSPYRRYAGAEHIPLALTTEDLATEYRALYEPDRITSREINLNNIGTLLELSMGLSAWKEYQGERWALRCNPSSGNLHPTETYVINGGLADLDPGVYHYVCDEHALERRCRYQLNSGTPEASRTGSWLLIGLTSVIWREAWKYGERSYRYCQLDVGHAVAAIRYACTLLGWRAEWLPHVSDKNIECLLGIKRDQDFIEAEREHADLMLLIRRNDSATSCPDIEQLVGYALQGQWSGKANILDQRHLYEWPILEEIANASRSTDSPVAAPWVADRLPSPMLCNTTRRAKEIIQRRRSAQLFDGISTIEASDFFRMLDMLLPRPGVPPWDALPWQPKNHLILFVHRINGLEPGLYCLVRNDHAFNSLQTALSEQMEWLRTDAAPAHLQLYRLVKANAQTAAARLSCHQAIASDGAFSLGMLSEFDKALTEGPWSYKHLYWEAGMLGQVLYLEAEAIDLQGTGIGCFFDDPVHEMLGINDTQYQSVYHFTVGGALNDSRLRTLMPYTHLNRLPAE